jgi:hypothetical protein
LKYKFQRTEGGAQYCPRKVTANSAVRTDDDDPADWSAMSMETSHQVSPLLLPCNQFQTNFVHTSKASGENPGRILWKLPNEPSKLFNINHIRFPAAPNLKQSSPSWADVDLEVKRFCSGFERRILMLSRWGL